ncbi:MAG: DUF3035 domain-containing protein [Alphaproteobacteria bacterium]|nr:DUF3035 domain-containing protein [Alphaproteobacteria bacterium]
MKMKTTLFGFALASSLLLAGCGGGEDVKEKLGLKAPPPDEFTVVTRAPLAVPPDYTLRPPRPGEDRPNELSVREQAKQTVFGVTAKPAAEKTTGQSAFLNKLGAEQADPNIRSSIDTEIRDLEEKEQPVAEKLLFWKDKTAIGKPIDPVEEQKRLEAQGIKKKTTTDTTVEKRNEDILKAE